jgi:hypothetical protein
MDSAHACACVEGADTWQALTRIYVVRPDGTQLSTGWLMLRELVLKILVGTLTLEISMMIGTAQVWWSGKPWWDHLVGSVVVQRSKPLAARPSRAQEAEPVDA